MGKNESSNRQANEEEFAMDPVGPFNVKVEGVLLNKRLVTKKN